MDVLARHEWFSLSILRPWYFFSFYGRGTLANFLFKKKKPNGEAKQSGKKGVSHTHTHTHASHDLDIKAKPDRDNTRAPKREKKNTQSGIKNDVTTFSLVILPLAPPPYPKKKKNWNTPPPPNPPYSFRLGKDFSFFTFQKSGWLHTHARKTHTHSTADRMATILSRGSSPLGVWPKTRHSFNKSNVISVLYKTELFKFISYINMINQTKIQTRKSVTNLLLLWEKKKRKKEKFCTTDDGCFFAPFVTCVSSTSKFQGYILDCRFQQKNKSPPLIFFGLLEISFRDRQKTWPFIAAIRSSTFSTVCVCYTHRQKSLFNFFLLFFRFTRKSSTLKVPTVIICTLTIYRPSWSNLFGLFYLGFD